MPMYMRLRGRLICLHLRRKSKTINLQCTSILKFPTKKVENVRLNSYLAVCPPSPPFTLSLSRKWASMNYNRLPGPQAFHWVHPPQ